MEGKPSEWLKKGGFVPVVIVICKAVKLAPLGYSVQSTYLCNSYVARSTTEEFGANPVKVDSPKNGVATTSKDFPNCLEPETRRIEDDEEKVSLEHPISGSLENGQLARSNELKDNVYVQ
ncbi:unnamed protein product [Dovyalis caffra]|uniref:Uncharacterized protein n=1 Tax=Dovyalis caffra TaxID=77055 RepID=A0AAV1RS75_9ROSI|nr:unnamed protein product [Dovyalis caffra]